MKCEICRFEIDPLENDALGLSLPDARCHCPHGEVWFADRGFLTLDNEQQPRRDYFADFAEERETCSPCDEASARLASCAPEMARKLLEILESGAWAEISSDDDIRDLLRKAGVLP